MKACLKKEWLEILRTKKLWVYLGIGLGIVVMSVALFFMMKMVENLPEAGEQMKGLMAMFDMTYSNSVSYYLSMMGTYFLIMIIVMTMRVVSKELEDKKWTLPICSGIKPGNMIAGKLIVHTAAIMAAFVAASLAHLAFTVIFFSADISVGKVLFYYAMLLVFVMFMTVLTISLNAIIKKGWLTCLISIFTFLFISTFLGMIAIGNFSLSDFSPFLFYDLSQSASQMFYIAGDKLWYHYLSAGLSTFVLMATLIFFAVRSSKVSADNLK